MEIVSNNNCFGQQESNKTALAGRRAVSPGVPADSSFCVSGLELKNSLEIGFPYLDIEKSQSGKPSQEPKHQANDKILTFTAYKCKCGCSWCPKCFLLRSSKGVSERISGMNWKSTRMITITIDPHIFKNDPLKAYEFLVREKKAIPQFMRDLQRTAGINVLDWVRVLEWHKNGFPHWHIFVDVGVEGQKGMIGHSVLKKYWSYGGCSESPIKSEHHFKKLSGYFGKFGYFSQGKGHQSKLPEWALLTNYRIRRYDSKRPQNQDSDIDLDVDSEVDSDGQVKEFRGYAAAISECGSETFIEYRDTFRFSKFSIPFEYFRTLPGEYVEGQGYVIEIWESEFLEFLQKYPGSLRHYIFENNVEREYERTLSILIN